MVISYPRDDHETKGLLQHIIEASDMDIVVVERDHYLTIGAARNEAIAKCNGDYICTWDDDDWYSERRIHDQYNNMLTVKQKREASILNHVVLYDGTTEKAYLSYPYKFAGTLLCKKNIVEQHPYEDANIIEDASLIRYLDKSRYLHLIPNRPDLYVYNYHGGNSLEKYYFLFFLGSAKPLDQTNTDWVKHMLNRQVDLL